jgi:penicillin G amidase
MMTMDLSSGESSERVRSAMVDALPIEIADFLTPSTTRFDAAIDASPKDRTGGYTPAIIPGPDVIDLRVSEGAGLRFGPEIFAAERSSLGSNSWAIAGSKTVHGVAILANDMHLMHALPNIWYRVQLEWVEESQADPRAMRLVGISLPGVPGVIVGSSGDLAWGFTNLTGDLVDLVRVEVHPDDPDQYQVPGGWENFGSRSERIEVRGDAAVEFAVRTTRWGPLVEPAHDGTPLAMRWAGLDPDRMNLELLEMPWAKSLEDGLRIMRSWMGPPQNALIADARGDIAWTLSGFLPERHGFDGRVSRSWANGDIGWNGGIPEGDRPRVVRPESGILFTANNRVLSGAAGSLRFGDDYSNGTRASRIRDLLESQEQWNELDAFRVALDTRAPMMDLYKEHLLRALPEPEAADELVAQAAELIKSWDGTSNADQVGYRLLREYRRRLHQSMVGPLLAPVHAAYPGFRYAWLNSDEPVLRLLDERPAHLLPPRYQDWDELLSEEFIAMVHELGPGDQGGIRTRWGKVNRSSIDHPLSAVLPQRFRGLLSTQRRSLDGDVWSVRVARPTFGASQRLAVSPGREDSGLLHMPGGQSGKPMSPHFKDQHPAWLSGDPLPLLAGPSQSRIKLTPEDAPTP